MSCFVILNNLNNPCFNQFVQADLRQICVHLPQSETSSKCLDAQLLGKSIIPFLSVVFTVQFSESAMITEKF